jgi:hypothetical protein
VNYIHYSRCWIRQNALITCIALFRNIQKLSTKATHQSYVKNITQLCAYKHDRDLIYEKYLFSVNLFNLSSGFLNTKSEEISSFVRLFSLCILLSGWEKFKSIGLIKPLLSEYVTQCCNIKKGLIIHFYRLKGRKTKRGTVCYLFGYEVLIECTHTLLTSPKVRIWRSKSSNATFK